MIEVRPSTPDDPPLLAPLLRAADVAEIEATGRTPLSALEEGVDHSRPCLTAWIGEEPVGMFGVRPCPDIEAVCGTRYGLIWYLGSDAATRDARGFMRASRAWLARLWEGYDVLGNAVDERNQVHIRWIGAMGFHFIKRHDAVGPDRRPFLEFYQPRPGGA